MTLGEFEQRLQQCNPRLRVRRIRDGMANIHLGNSQKAICRVDTGELTVYNQFKYRTGFADQYITSFNQKGAYKYKHMIKRGRAELARVLYTQRVISLNHISTLSK